MGAPVHSALDCQLPLIEADVRAPIDPSSDHQPRTCRIISGGRCLTACGIQTAMSVARSGRLLWKKKILWVKLSKLVELCNECSQLFVVGSASATAKAFREHSKKISQGCPSSNSRSEQKSADLGEKHEALQPENSSRRLGYARPTLRNFTSNRPRTI